MSGEGGVQDIPHLGYLVGWRDCDLSRLVVRWVHRSVFLGRLCVGGCAQVFGLSTAVDATQAGVP